MASAAIATSPDPRPARRPFGDSLRLESTGLTVVYWVTAFLFALAFWLPPFPPLIDYPQHVAVGALLRRMADPSSPERALYDVNLVTYNGGFHLLLAALSFAVRPETAGKILVSIYPFAFAFAALQLVRVAERPRWYALLALPITFSFAVGWGFANYFMSVPFVLLTFSLWLRARRGEAGVLWKVMLASLFLSYTHVLATLCLCVTIGMAGLAAPAPGEDTLRARLLGILKLPLAVWPAVLWSTVVFVRNRYSPHANWEGWDEGKDDPLWFKLAHAPGYAVGNFGDYSDQILLGLTVALVAVLFLVKERERPAEPLMQILAVTWATLYCVVPKVFIATWFIFERFPTFVLVFAAAAAPVPSARAGGGRVMHLGRIAAAVLALAAGLNTVGHLGRIPGEDDAVAAIDAIPPGSRVISVLWSNTGQPVIQREMWVHLLAYYQARRPGQIAYSFAKFESMPVHYAVGKAPPAIPGGMEWDGDKYDPTASYARYWNIVLVRTPDDDPDRDPRARTFRAAAPRIRVMARFGRFWLFDASDLAPPPPGPAPLEGAR